MLLLEFMKWGAFFIIFMTLWKLATIRFSDSVLGEGMAFISN